MLTCIRLEVPGSVLDNAVHIIERLIASTNFSKKMLPFIQLLVPGSVLDNASHVMVKFEPRLISAR